MGEQRLNLLGAEVRRGRHQDAAGAAGYQKETVLPHRVTRAGGSSGREG